MTSPTTPQTGTGPVRVPISKPATAAPINKGNHVICSSTICIVVLDVPLETADLADRPPSAVPIRNRFGLCGGQKKALIEMSRNREKSAWIAMSGDASGSKHRYEVVA